MPLGAPRGLPCTTAEVLAGELSPSCRSLSSFINLCSVFTPGVSLLQGGSHQWRLRFAAGRFGRSGETRQSDAELGRVQRGETRGQSHGRGRREHTRVTPFPAAAGGPSLLVGKRQRL